MRIPAAIALGLQIILPQALLGPRFAEAQEPAPSSATCMRLVDFRDGSILRVELPADHLFNFRQTSSGDNRQLDIKQIRLDAAQSLRFSRLPALEQLRSIQAAVAELHADNFRHRERALKALVDGGNGFRPFLEDLFNTISDPETRWRLAAALSLLPPHAGLYEHAYDEITTSSGTTKGDIDDWQITANYRGTQLDLNRKTVRSIRAVPLTGDKGVTPVIATTEPIRKDLDAFFPQGSTRIDFEEDPNGNPLRPGEDISRRFIPAGVLMNTSVDGAILSVNDYPVSGRSGGQSAATHEPLYEGTITLTFCVPGDEHELAGVTHVGFYAAVVMPEGTTLAAFDASGHRIASVTTESGPHEFLGLRSNVPIHQVKIIPNEDIDPNFTFDDLIFDLPKPLDAGANPKHYGIELASGERFICADFQIAGDKVTLQPAAKFAGEITFPAADIVQLHTPTDTHADAPPVDGVPFWLMLDDGSTLRASASENQAVPKAIQGIPVTDLPLTALWSDAKDLIPLPGDTQLTENQVAAINTSEPMILSDPKFTATKFTAVRDDATVQYSYNRLPSVWLKNPNEATRSIATGFVRLNTGERVVLGKSTTFRLENYSSQAITLTRDDKPFQVPLGSITTLRIPR